MDALLRSIPLVDNESGSDTTSTVADASPGTAQDGRRWLLLSTPRCPLLNDNIK